MNEVDCRRSQILQYFDEAFSADKCNKTCDNCKRGLGSVVLEDYSHQARAIVRVVEALSSAGLPKLTLNLLRSLLSTSKDKKLERYRAVLSRRNLDTVIYGKGAGADKPVSKTICEKILQAMVIEQYLLEESQVRCDIIII
jgi:superfamily II DNA helicase RecQ